MLLVGEAGIGKSRLLHGLREAIHGPTRTEVSWQCSPFHGDTPLWPVLPSLVGEPSGASIDTLERRLRESGADLMEAVPLLAAQLGLAPDKRYPPVELVPAAQRPRLLAVLVEHLVGLAKRRPVLIILEDAHWADATTLELARLLVDRIADLPVMLALTSRPEGQPQLSAHAHLTVLGLGRLGRAAIASIVATMISGEVPPAALLDAVVNRTDGVPLFVEELTKALVEQGPIRDGPAMRWTFLHPCTTR